MLKKILSFVIALAVSFSVLSSNVYAADNYNAKDFFEYYVSIGAIPNVDGSYAIQNGDSIFLSSRDKGSDASIKYATVGIRVFFGDNYCWSIDLPRDWYVSYINGEKIYVRMQSYNDNFIGLKLIDDMKTYNANGTSNKVYSLYEISYKSLQNAIVTYYGEGSQQAAWISADYTKTKYKSFKLNHIMTKCVVTSSGTYFDCGYSHSKYSAKYPNDELYFDNNSAAFAYHDGFWNYFYNSTGAVLRPEFKDIYFNIPLTIPVYPESGYTYEQTVYYRKKRTADGSYVNFTSAEIYGQKNPYKPKISWGIYYTPPYLSKNPKGYLPEKITPQKALISYPNATNNVFYVDYKPINYWIKYDGNGATGGNMGNTNHYYDYQVNIPKNTFVRNYKVEFNNNGGENSILSLKSNYEFLGWNTKNNGTAAFTDGQNVQNLSETDGSTVTLYAIWKPEMIKLPDAKYEHYTFFGWSEENLEIGKEPPAKQMMPGTTYIPTKNVTLNGIWYSYAPVLYGDDISYKEATPLSKDMLLKDIICTDVEDGNLYDQIVIEDYDGLNMSKPKAGFYDIKLSVTDYSGKKTEFTRKLEIENVPPVIEGDDEGDYLFARASFDEKNLLEKFHVKASDVYDGDLTYKVKFEDVDGLKLKTKSNWHRGYNLLISVEDSNGAVTYKKLRLEILYKYVRFVEK